jgi:hypothetical protein
VGKIHVEMRHLRIYSTTPKRAQYCTATCFIARNKDNENEGAGMILSLEESVALEVRHKFTSYFKETWPDKYRTVTLISLLLRLSITCIYRMNMTVLLMNI